MPRVWVERTIVAVAVGGLIGLAFLFGIWAAVLVAVALCVVLILIILLGGSVGPPPDKGTFV